MPDKIAETELSKVIYDNQELIIKVCKIYCRNQSDIDDLFQDITINLWKGLSSFKGNSKLSTWIYRVSINTAISKFRKKRKLKFVGLDNVTEQRGASAQEHEMDKENSVRALYYGIDSLNPVEKAIILLYLEDKTYGEIADIVGISKSNVSVRLVRVKRKLETIIKPLLK